MNKEIKVNQILVRTQIMSAIIWAAILIAYNYKDFEKMNIILLSGAFIEFIVLSSSFAGIKKILKSITNIKKIK